MKRLCELVEIEPLLVLRLAGRPAPPGSSGPPPTPQLAERIRAVHDADNTYGAPRITAELNDGAPPEAAGQPQAGRPGDARARHRRLPAAPQGPHHDPRTRRPEGARPAATGTSPPPAPNQRYVGDITYLPLADGANLYLATVIDCYSRRLAGWAVADHMRTELVDDALTAARRPAGVLAGAIFHSDHGAQSTPRRTTPGSAPSLGVTQSMGAVGTSADNASPSRSTPPSNARSSKTRTAWPDEADLPPPGLPVADPLQHPPPPLLVPLPVPDHLRDQQPPLRSRRH